MTRRNTSTDFLKSWLSGMAVLHRPLSGILVIMFVGKDKYHVIHLSLVQQVVDKCSSIIVLMFCHIPVSVDKKVSIFTVLWLAI